MTNAEEKVVAVVEPTKAAGEEDLAMQVSKIKGEANQIVVQNDEQYKEAGEFGVLLKTKIGEIADFFAPMKKAAHDAHKQICDREKEMLAPLKDAEAKLKRSMGDYVLEKERVRLKLEEEAKKTAEEEAKRKMEEAIKAEEEGNEEALKDALISAEIAEHEARNVTVETDSVKVKGISTTKDWEITNIDVDKVPVSIMGTVIRPVDEAMVKKLIKATKGTIQIEGITYKEKIVTSFRRGV